jgi:type VI secretion system secreted protein Hcp
MRNVKLLSIIVLTSIAGIIGSSAMASAASTTTPFDQLNAAITTLTTNLNNEIARAMGAESTLTTNLSNEITRATGAESTLTTSLNNEITDRKQADTDTLSSAKSYTDQQLATHSANSMSENMCNPSSGSVDTKFMTLTGAIQGQIKGDVTQKGREGDIAIIAVCNTASRQFDPATGLLTGPRTFEPFTFIKTDDRSSPQLYQALTTGEKLSVKINYFTTNQLGEEVLFQTITLTDALITSIHEVKVDTADKQGINHFGEYEEVTMTFQKIDIENQVSKTSYSDDWTAK